MLSSWRHCCGSIQQRWVFAIMGFFATVNAYTMRICLSLAIVEMVGSTESSTNSTYDDTCANLEASVSSSSSSGTYDWDEYTQGVILSSFFWGYVITHLPGGMLAEKFGGKYTLGLGILSTAIFTLLTPIVVERFDAPGLITLRFFMGLMEGTTFPAVNVLLSRWCPPHERSLIGSTVLAGAQVGTVVGTSLTGVLIEQFTIGWPLVFYVFGIFGVAWFLVFVVVCYNSPDDHPFISEREKKYLHEMTSEHMHKKSLPTPWKRILLSVPLWALVAGEVGHDWGFYTMVTDLPKYMNSVLKFSIQANGFLTALPYLCMWLVSIVSSWIADWLIKNDKLSRTNVRKIFTTVAAMGPAIFIVAASYAGCDRLLVVALFTIGMALMGPFIPGMKVNTLDLSPNFSGTLMAIVNGLGAVTGILAPYVVGIVTPNQTLSEWRLIFWMTFVIFLVTNGIFVIWADGEVQYWNDPDYKKNTANHSDDESRKPSQKFSGAAA